MAQERRVLLVEDDPDVARLYLQQLRHDGVPLEHVRTGAAADAFVRGRLPALVLIDLKLPDGDGREWVERWGADPICSSIPVWIVSNSDAEDNLWWHTTPNVQRYFQKSRVVFSRLSLEIRATLGLPYGERINHRAAS